MKIGLEPWELEVAYTVGMRRDHANTTKRDARHYDPSRMEDNLRASVASAACELAVAKATCCYWTMSVWDSSQHLLYRNLPDVLPNIEVRRVRERNNPLVVRKREVIRDRVIVSAYAEAPWFRVVEVLGWARASYAWEKGTPAAYDLKATRLLDQDLLLAMEDLTAEELADAS